MTTSRPDRVVTVIAPSTAPHLAPIATDIERQLQKHIETLPTDALRHLLRMGSEAAQAREEYERLRQRLGVK